MVENMVDQNKELLELTRENNKMLHALRRHQRWASVFTGLYWLVILGAGVAAFHFLQPYLDSLLKAYDQIQGTLGKFSSF